MVVSGHTHGTEQKLLLEKERREQTPGLAFPSCIMNKKTHMVVLFWFANRSATGATSRAGRDGATEAPSPASGGYKTTPWKANLFASPCAVALVRTSVFPAAFVCFMASAMALIYGLGCV
jgi:hypothetical protein